MSASDIRSESRRRFLKFLSGSPLLAYPGLGTGAPDSPTAPPRLSDPIIWAPLRTEDLIKSPAEGINVFDFEPVARKTVPPAHFGYMASGIDDEVTLRANREGFLKFQLRPRRLNDVSKRIGNMNAIRRRLPRPRPRSPRHKVPDSGAERRRSRIPQCTSATFLRVERAGPSVRHARPDRPPPSIDRWTGRISTNATSRRHHDGVCPAPEPIRSARGGAGLG